MTFLKFFYFNEILFILLRACKVSQAPLRAAIDAGKNKAGTMGKLLKMGQIDHLKRKKAGAD
ncbi:MAG: hypothetical protein Q4C95_12825 [Planctomycetia bacterium]|nr:hypothetical protein [Planctomycetia bacterium]